MKKILVVIIIVIIIACSAFLFYDFKLDKERSTIYFTGRIGKMQTRRFMYGQNFVFSKLAGILNGMPTPAVHKELDHELPFPMGEKLQYDVYYAGLKAGESVLTFHGVKDLNGREAYYVTFSTELPFFKDYEEIYASKETFLPLKINRRIIKLGGLSAEHIEEIYDQDNFTVTISRGRKPSKKPMVIKKEHHIHNAILLTYYYRSNPEIAKMSVLNITLPTQEFSIKAAGQETVETPLGSYPADIFTSEPAKFTFYISKDFERLPIKITSQTVLNYVLILSSKDTIK